MNKRSLFRLSAMALSMAFIFTACKKKDDDPAPASTASVTCKIDGVAFKGSMLNNTLIGGGTSEKRLDIRGTDASGKQMIISINDIEPVGTDFTHLGDTVYVDPYENSPIGIVSLGTLIYKDNSFIMSTGEGKKAGYAMLTSHNMSSKKISGVFEFILIDFATDDSVHVTEGKFTNVSYTQF